MSTDMTFEFSQLPFDIFHNVASRLDHFSLDRLAKTAKSSRRLLQTENTVKVVMQLALSPLQPGPGPRQTLARIVDSQSALQQASPYSVCILAYSRSFIYSMGVLCYTTSDFTLRILNFNHRRDTEQVFGREFFTGQVCIANRDQATIELESLKLMQVESYADGIVVLQCSVNANSARYILAVDIKKTSNPPRPRIRLCVSTLGPGTNKLFVRNNERFIVLGTNWGGEQTWLLDVYDFETSQRVNGEPLRLPGWGSRIGSTVAFTIYKDQFYAVTNWVNAPFTSYYGITMFSKRLGDPDAELTKNLIWRRQNIDGPHDDTWADLSFQIDYSTGELLVVEGRKEWGPEGGPLIRAYQTTPIRRANFVLADEIDNSRRLSAGRYIHAQFRDDGGEKEATAVKEYDRHKTKWIGYSFNAQTFVELITDDPNVKGEWLPRERTKLRVTSRQELSPLVKDAVNPEDWVLRKPKRDPEGREMEDGERAFTANTISLWPPEDAPKDLQDMLHCKCFRRQDAKAAVGDEGIFFRAGGPGSVKRSLVLICCDPTFGFQGMRRLDGSLARPKWDMKTEDDCEFDVEHPHNRGVTLEPAMYGVIGRGYWVR
ncbi:hypothetical protein FOPE_10286 [Fonsecaea pedrosoi]|nr:hypothetical protein FOPE_10286 [Fonsecaea pedrosoi]